MTTLSCAYRPHTAVWTRTTHSSSARGKFTSPCAISAGIPSTSHRIAGVGRYSASTTRSTICHAPLRRALKTLVPRELRRPTPPAPPAPSSPWARRRARKRECEPHLANRILSCFGHSSNGHITSPGAGPSTHRRANRASAGISPREPARIRSLSLSAKPRAAASTKAVTSPAAASSRARRTMSHPAQRPSALRPAYIPRPTANDRVR